MASGYKNVEAKSQKPKAKRQKAEERGKKIEKGEN